ncbi:Uncharacterised protein [Amycolatopsis camponoti]|uniref:Uncharacterized protein n=1 Tax=Amycolatopsis camponoti TaxID=2606593 RepID=A0A6I8LGT0_9PSEU|nr:hypothetical protein [Amycolatopsis camponoti]VVJ15498.1 Uncharacterised protein [Amycolatopsis camponoti]
MSVPPPAPGGQQPVGQPDPYGPPPGGQPQQQYGQPGQYGTPPGTPPQGMPGQYGPPPGQPGFPPAPPVPPKKSKALWIRLGIVALIVIVGGIVAVVKFTSAPENAAVGECLSVAEFTEITSKNMPEKVACGDQSANVLVAAKQNGTGAQCPGDGYIELTVDRPASTMCMIPNVKQGECFTNFPDGPKAFSRVACTDPSASAEFVKVAAVNDRAQCDGTDADGVLAYSTPPTTFCFKTKK